MIDNYIDTMTLMEKMESHLPIPAHPTEFLVFTLREHDTQVSANSVLYIESLVYLGDYGGIGCAVKLPVAESTAVVTSLTHVSITAGHPLAEEIRQYQTKRILALAKVEGHTLH